MRVSQTQVSMIACQGVASRRLLDQIGSVLDPLAHQHRGEEPERLRSTLQRSWRAAFHADLPEPTLSRCVAAIRTGQPWQIAVWAND